jgi:hypothetical protein
MDAATQAAVGAGQDIFSVNELSERDDVIGYQFPVLHEAGAMNLPCFRNSENVEAVGYAARGAVII